MSRPVYARPVYARPVYARPLYARREMQLVCNDPVCKLASMNKIWILGPELRNLLCFKHAGNMCKTACHHFFAILRRKDFDLFGITSVFYVHTD